MSLPANDDAKIGRRTLIGRLTKWSLAPTSLSFGALKLAASLAVAVLVAVAFGATHRT